jgi:hypothetical protein
MFLNRLSHHIAVAAAVGAWGLSLGATPGTAAVIAPAFSGSYTVSDFGTPSGIPANLGGITFLNNNTLLIGGAANQASGAIYRIGVNRDATTQQITGFSGPASFYASAPYIDGGLAFGPGGVLFYTGYPVNQLGQIRPGSVAPDRVDTLPAAYSSVGTLNFVATGQPGEGNLVLASYNLSTWGLVDLVADGAGTFAPTVSPVVRTIPGGPEGIVWVPPGSPIFSGDTALVSQYDLGSVQAFAVDADGLPTGPGTNFVTGLTGAEGAVIDPVTGSFLFSTFGGGNRVVMVSGFAAPPPPPPPTDVPAPASALLLVAGLLGLGAVRRRRGG